MVPVPSGVPRGAGCGVCELVPLRGGRAESVDVRLERGVAMIFPGAVGSSDGLLQPLEVLEVSHLNRGVVPDR